MTFVVYLRCVPDGVGVCPSVSVHRGGHDRLDVRCVSEKIMSDSTEVPGDPVAVGVQGWVGTGGGDVPSFL